MVNRERDDNIYYARLAEQGERYEDMIRYMKEVAAVSYPIPATILLLLYLHLLYHGSHLPCSLCWLIDSVSTSEFELLC